MTIPANSTLWLPEVEAVLERLHVLADDGDEALGEKARYDPAWKAANSQQKATMLQDALLPVSRDAGRFLYAVTRSISAKLVVEFGTSFPAVAGDANLPGRLLPTSRPLPLSYSSNCRKPN